MAGKARPAIAIAVSMREAPARRSVAAARGGVGQHGVGDAPPGRPARSRWRGPAGRSRRARPRAPGLDGGQQHRPVGQRAARPRRPGSPRRSPGRRRPPHRPRPAARSRRRCRPARGRPAGRPRGRRPRLASSVRRPRTPRPARRPPAGSSRAISAATTAGTSPQDGTSRIGPSVSAAGGQRVGEHVGAGQVDGVRGQRERRLADRHGGVDAGGAGEARALRP